MKNDKAIACVNPREGRPVPLRCLAIFLTICVLTFGIIGYFAMQRGATSDEILHLFHLDRELNLVSAFSTLLLIVCGFLVFRLLRSGRDRNWAGCALGGFFIFMGLDEMFKIHETSEKLTGIDWQILYLPLILMGGIGWAVLWFQGDRPFRWLWTGGAAAWVISQLLEAAQWGWWRSEDLKADNYDVYMIAEELLEITGSCLFLLALYHLCWPPARERKSKGAAEVSCDSECQVASDS